MSPRPASPLRYAARVALALGLGLAGLLVVAASPGASDSGEGAVAAAARVQRALSLGTEHSCAITDAGTVECWGDNQFGQLGTGDTATSTQPRLVSGVSGALEVAAGNGHTCVLVHGGSVKCWGLNSSGQLGHPPGYDNSSLPVSVTGISGATRLVSGDFHSCVLLGDGSVKCWGQDGMGQLGDGDPGDYTNQPVTVQGLPAGDPVVDLAAGQWDTCARTQSKQLWCWGHNGFGQLGDGTTTDRPAPTRVLDPDDVSGVAGPELGKVLAVSGGAGHTCAVIDVSGGAVVCWGQNNFGQLGYDTTKVGDIMQPSLKPGRVEEDGDSSPLAESDVVMDDDVRAVSAGGFHTCASATSNAVFCWGQGDHAQLGYDYKPTPPGKKGYIESSRWARPVPGLNAAGVVAGGFHTCSVGGGDLKCWGYDFHGQLGGYQPQVSTPTVVTALQGASKVAVGTSFACALLKTEPAGDPDTGLSPYCWGDNDNGRLGTDVLGPTEETTVRVPVAGIGTATEIRAGNGTACALPTSGARRCWGLNASGEIGDLSQVDRPTPVASANLTGATAYDLGGTLSGSERGTTCRVDAGHATCWGYNGQGQLGNGTTTDSLTPVTVLYDADPDPGTTDPQPLAGVTAVATGGDHACAIVGGGQVRCWGANGAGQLGDNTSAARQYAVLVQEDTDADPDAVDPLDGATALVAGDSHTCALLSSGEVRCWGLGSSGQLGRTGSGLQANLPVRWQPPPPAGGADDLDAVGRIVSGDDHTCALRTDQSLVCWGENDDNQLGAGSGDSSVGLVVLEKPDVDLGGQPWIRDVAAGRLNTCAVMLDRTVWCWGDNSHGQVGDGLGLHSLAPVDVGGSASFAQNQIPEPPPLLIETSPDTPATINVSLAGMDPDGGTVSLTGVGLPGQGTSSFTASPATITYTPTSGSGCHDDTFTYTVSDGTASVEGVVRVDMNCAPVAVPDTATVAEDGSVLVDVVANDTDDDPGDTLTLSAVTADTPHGTAVIEAGKVRYTPDADFCSPPTDAFGYTVDDGHGHLVPGVLTVTVTCAADGPAVGPDVASTPEETPVVIDVLGNDDDADGDGLTVVSVSAAAHGTTSTDGSTVRYAPEANYCGPDSFTYTASDGTFQATATVTVSVTCADDSPRAAHDQASTPEDTSVLIDVLANDTDPDPGALTIDALGTPLHGTTAVEAGQVRYTPAPDYCGPDSFSYAAKDPTGLVDTASVEVSVGCRNDAPVAVADTATTPEDTTVHVHVVLNDLDVDGDALSLVQVGAAAHGTTAGAIDNAVAYTPAADYCGPDSFTYRVKDPAGEVSDGVVSITVTCVDDPTVFAPVGNALATWGDPLSVPLSASDPDGPVTFSVVSGPAGATTSGASFTWTPTAEQVGSHTITVRATDGTSSAQRSFQVSVGKRATALAYTGSVTAQVSDPVNAAAVLTDAATGFPVAGRSVGFALGGSTASGTTGAGGAAAGTLLATAPLGARVLTASFAGDPAYTGSSTSSGVTVTREAATIALGGTPHVTTAGSSASVTYTALLVEESDGTLADTLAGTAVVFRRLDGSTVCTATATRTTAGRAQASCSSTQPVGALPVVVAGTSASYAMNVDVGVVTLANTGAGFASGAGRVGSDDFGFQVRPAKKGSPPTGNLVHAWVAGGSVRVVNATTLGTLTTSCTRTTPKVCSVKVTGTAASYASVDLVTGAVTTTSSASSVTVDAVDPNKYAVAITGGAPRTLGSAASPLTLDFGAVKVTP